MLSLTWRSFLVYTDSWGMLFVALILFIYTSNMKWKYKAPLLFAVAAIGTFIKATVFICVLAVGLHALLIAIRKCTDDKKTLIKKVSWGVICIILCFGGMILIQNTARQYCGLQTGKLLKGWKYFFMLGQNSDSYGCVNGTDGGIWSSYADSYTTNEKMGDAALREALSRIQNRGLIGNMSFYLHKLTVAYNDGYFHNVSASGEETSSWGSLYFAEGKYYSVLANLFQILWDGMLLLLFLNALLRRRSVEFSMFEIAVIGITLYLMCFEDRSKYLFMFLPIYLAGAGVALQQLSTYYNWIGEKLSLSHTDAADT